MSRRAGFFLCALLATAPVVSGCSAIPTDEEALRASASPPAVAVLVPSSTAEPPADRTARTRPRRADRTAPPEATVRPANDPADRAGPTPTDRPRRIRPTPRPTEPPAPPTLLPEVAGLDAIAGSDGRFTVLLLGSDARRGLTGERTDAIMVASIDPGTGKVAMASLPRDTVNVPIAPGQVFEAPNRVNALLQSWELRGVRRGEALRRMVHSMSYAFGIEIDGYVVIGFRGLERLIDRIGGVEIDLDRPLRDPTMHVGKGGLDLPAGTSRLDGRLALAFARTRHSDSDYQRAGRQQQLIAATAKRVLELGPDAIPALASFALSQVETDIPLDALPQLLELAERARWNGVKGTVLGPSRFAGPGAETYTIELRLEVVRAFFDRWFAPVG